MQAADYLQIPSTQQHPAMYTDWQLLRQTMPGISSFLF
jgi:hypothetical protein